MANYHYRIALNKQRGAWNTLARDVHLRIFFFLITNLIILLQGPGLIKIYFLLTWRQGPKPNTLHRLHFLFEKEVVTSVFWDILRCCETFLFKQDVTSLYEASSPGGQNLGVGKIWVLRENYGICKFPTGVTSLYGFQLRC